MQYTARRLQSISYKAAKSSGWF